MEEELTKAQQTADLLMSDIQQSIAKTKHRMNTPQDRALQMVLSTISENVREVIELIAEVK